MSADNDGWIKMSERQPALSAYPVWQTNRAGGVTLVVCHAHDIPGSTHWQPATLPAPPAKEMTQAEKDTEEYTALFGDPLCFYSSKGCQAYTSDVWHAALAYRDAQNREDLKKPLDKERQKVWGLIDPDAHTNLRRRCGLDNGGGK